MFWRKTNAYLMRRRGELAGSSFTGTDEWREVSKERTQHRAVRIIDKVLTILRDDAENTVTDDEFYYLLELCPDLNLKLELDQWLESESPRCIPERVLYAVVEGRLESDESAAFYRHISSCWNCMVDSRGFFDKDEWDALIAEERIKIPESGEIDDWPIWPDERQKHEEVYAPRVFDDSFRD